ncbi:hypothetical protein ACWGDT_11435 [Streptomyces avermitilis]
MRRRSVGCHPLGCRHVRVEFHDHSIEFIPATVSGNAAIAIAYAAMPAPLVIFVADKDTGVANSINSIMRTMGGAVGTAIVITILARSAQNYRTPTGPVAIATEDA